MRVNWAKSEALLVQLSGEVMPSLPEGFQYGGKVLEVLELFLGTETKNCQLSRLSWWLGLSIIWLPQLFGTGWLL